MQQSSRGGRPEPCRPHPPPTTEFLEDAVVQKGLPNERVRVHHRRGHLILPFLVSQRIDTN
jgi:hypothetical protein